MSVNEGFEKLGTIGAQKIHEKTHISKYHVQALLHNNFDDMTKIQFLGFVSILEREYKLHLDDLRERGLEYFYNQKTVDDESRIFLKPVKTKSNTFFYIALVVILILIGMSYSFITAQEEEDVKVNIQNNETIKIVQENILKINSDINITEEVIVEEKIEEEPPQKELSFKIIPNTRLWIGYIDLTTHAKKQTTTSNPIELDPNKDWLLNLGHADIDIEIHGEIKKYNKSTNIRFLYKEQELKEVGTTEFRSLNKGSLW